MRPWELVNPYAFEPAIAPHIAAELVSEEILIERIAASYRRLCAIADTVIVEGAGGFMIPLNARQTSARTLPARWSARWCSWSACGSAA